METIQNVLPLRSGGALLQFADGSATQVPQAWIEQHNPQPGGQVDLTTEAYINPKGEPA